MFTLLSFIANHWIKSDEYLLIVLMLLLVDIIFMGLAYEIFAMHAPQ